jgi:hypothetical protein
LPLWRVYSKGQLKALYGIEVGRYGRRKAKLYAWVGQQPERILRTG